jgi:HEAT repeat protein
MRWLILLLLAPTFALADEEEVPDLPVVDADEEIPELRTVQATGDPVAELVSRASNPAAPEEAGQRLFDQLVAMGPSALTSLSMVYRDPKATDHESWVAARAMARIGGEDSARTQAQGLTSKRIITRLGAVSGLRLMKHAPSTSALEQALFDKALTVRVAAADALAEIGSRGSHKALAQALNLPANFHHGRSLFVREHIVKALGDVGSIGGIDALIGVLSEKEPELQRLATVSLSSITGRSFRDSALGDSAPPTPAEIEAWQQWWSKRQSADQINQRVIEN